MFSKVTLIKWKTDRSKISSNQKRLFFAVSLYPLHFSRTLPLNYYFIRRKSLLNRKPKNTKAFIYWYTCFLVYLRKNSYAQLFGKELAYIYVFLRIYHTKRFFLSVLVFQKRIFTKNCVYFLPSNFFRFIGFYFTYFSDFSFFT